MKKLLSSLLLSTTLFAFQADAQTALQKPNIIKVNLGSSAFGIYQMQYERIINPKQSIGLAMSYAPNQDLPFKSALLNIFGDNAQAETAINSTLLNTFSVNLEYRFYSEIKGAPLGFYAATFLRYTNMEHSGTYLFNLSDGEHKPDITTTFNGFGVGEMIGIQWELSPSVTLDWWILGPYFGYLNGSSHGDDDRPILDEDKAKLETDIEDIGNSIPGWNVDATVTDNPSDGLGLVDAELKGLFYGARVFGICLGYRF